jgi:hypothetical protein
MAVHAEESDCSPRIEYPGSHDQESYDRECATRYGQHRAFLQIRWLIDNPEKKQKGRTGNGQRSDKHSGELDKSSSLAIPVVHLEREPSVSPKTERNRQNHCNSVRDEGPHPRQPENVEQHQKQRSVHNADERELDKLAHGSKQEIAESICVYGAP